MSWEFYRNSEHIARKAYPCDAADYICAFGLNEFTPEEQAVIAKAESEKWMILPGQRYLKTVGKWDGYFETFRARPELNALCHEYGLYPED